MKKKHLEIIFSYNNKLFFNFNPEEKSVDYFLDIPTQFQRAKTVLEDF